ncbi:MAG: methyltransferase [Acidobacteria bacterium]|nr:MAG: methyltransferase [Acidobacteriota bacterium]
MSQQTKPCRSCHATGLISILDLGHTPLANGLLTHEQLVQPEATYPLELVFCSHCTLIQITETVPPEQLFRNYFYLSSFSDTMLQHAQQLVGKVMRDRTLGVNSLVVEVASNDGYLLQYYKQANVPVLGIEPAQNIARIAQDKGIDTISEFFSAELAEQLLNQGKRADVIHANNVLAHVADLNGFVRGLGLLLKDDGVAVIEVPYVKDMIDRSEFDTIYHEHLCYFSLTALSFLFARHGMFIRDVKHIDIHGGTLQFFAGRANGDANSVPSAAVVRLLKEEEKWGVANPEFYGGFGDKVERLRRELNELLKQLKDKQKRIAVYGASAKGSTLLNYFGIGSETVDFVVDRSVVKRGHYTPGTHLPICEPEKLLKQMPDYTLLLTWNFADEILEQQAEYRRRGGRFIVPIPDLKIV